MMKTPIVYLIEGPVGAGKSTYAEQLSKEVSAPHLNLDAWMTQLFQGDRPHIGIIEWYVARKERCTQQILDVTMRLVKAKCSAILELGLLHKDKRFEVYEQLNQLDCEVKIYVLDAPRDLRRERVKQRNIEKGSTFSMEVPQDIFEMASDMWQAPDEQEIEDLGIIFI